MNPHGGLSPADFKSAVSADFTIRALVWLSLYRIWFQRGLECCFRDMEPDRDQLRIRSKFQLRL